MNNTTRKPNPFRGMMSEQVREGIRLHESGLSINKAAAQAGCAPRSLSYAKKRIAAEKKAEAAQCRPAI